ncbi:MAG: DUF1592 domain-containing protein [Planctomycetaceae bacterium]|nr:DUF1592 domain-containing protein [Planctomycetales bacterium]MCB9922246.1 DUF1592 domain-containing protein [Planctomycetaceae bacterium]
MLKRSLNTSCFVVLALASAEYACADATLPTQLTPFLERHCFDCHSGDEPEAGLNLQTMSTDIADADVRRRWAYLYDRVATGEMPPKSAEQPDAKAKAQLLETLADSLTRADAIQREVVLRRLNRREYEHGVRDLFDIVVDVQSILPDDSAEQGFDTIGSDLSVSAEQMVAYIEAADVVLDQVFGSATAPPRRINQTVNFKDLRSKDTADRILPDGVVLFSGAKDLPLYGVSVSGPATYRLRIQAKAIQTDRPVVMQVNGGVTGRIPGHVAGFFAVPPDKLTTIELTDRAVENSDTFSFGLIGGFPWWSVKEDEYEGAGLFLGDIHIEGPLEQWPPPSRTRLFGNVDPSNGTLEDIRGILSRIMREAFRRPVNSDEVEPYVALAKQALDEGVSFEGALRRGLKGVICAPEFLYLEESVEERQQSRESQRIDDFALASRLSFFLWSSLPDAELLALAERGELGRPDVLREQVERMLADPKSQRFVESFTGQWLRLDDIDFTVPDQSLYPEYDQLLRQSMLGETHAFFRELLDRDLSVQNFIDADFVMINQPLADFYGIEGVDGLEMRRVDLPDNSPRGGVLTQASVLKVSADGTRTSPVLRGAWILKYFFGTPSPPPPAGVVAVEPDIRGATTIREQLAKHREHESCNRCHRKIDPPGFALESFDVIGAQRDWYRTRGSGKYLTIPRHPQAPKHYVQYRQGPDVDASGTKSDGQPFTGIHEYKQLLLKDNTAMPRALTRLLLSYSLGLHLGFSDRPAVERIVESVESHHYGLRSLIHAVVQSETFRQP